MPMPTDTNLNRSFIRDDVYDALKTWIVEGVLEPKETLRDKDLAAQLGVSRTPVREALRKLEDEGLVETAANRWTRVSGVSVKDAEQIYPIILSLELLALDLGFAHLSSEDIRTMTEHNTRLADALSTTDARAAVQADTNFHNVLIHAANNTELSSILKQLKSKAQRLELAYFSDADLLQASVKEHEQLSSALKNKQLEAAQQMLKNNWQTAIERLKRLGLSHHKEEIT